MLLDPEPLVVGYLGLGDLIFALAVHLEDRLVDLAHFGLIGCAILVPEMDLMLAIFTIVICIDVGLGCFVQPLQQSFIVQVLEILLIHTNFFVDASVFII